MSLLLLLSTGGGGGGLAVAYGGDAAELYEPDDIYTGIRVVFGGDVAQSFEPDFVRVGALAPLVVAYGGDASGRWPVRLFVTVDGVQQVAGADPENRLRFWHGAVELDDSFARGFSVGLSDPGSWTCTLGNEDPALAAVDYGDLVRIGLDGATVLLGIVESIDATVISPSEEAGQVTVLAGRGVVAEWERARIMPSTTPGSRLFGDTRYFGWMSAELLDSTWASARRQWKQNTVADGYEAKHGTPLGWPDPDGWWIWSTAPVGDPPLHDPGVSYFRNGFTITVAADVAIYAAADDAFELYLDGVPIGGNGQLNGWREPFRADVTLEPARHIVAIKAENYVRAPATNTAGLIVAIYTLDTQGRDQTLLLRTGNSGWEAAHLPDVPPGFTVGHVIRVLLEEAQADGELVGWTLDFDDSTDTAGNPWTPNEQFSFPVGLDLFAALEQLADTHIDFLMDPSTRTLRAWRHGEAGVPAELATAELIDGVDSLLVQGRA